MADASPKQYVIRTREGNSIIIQKTERKYRTNKDEPVNFIVRVIYKERQGEKEREREREREIYRERQRNGEREIEREIERWGGGGVEIYRQIYRQIDREKGIEIDQVSY